MLSVRWSDGDQHVRIYDETGQLVSIFPGFYAAEQALDQLELAESFELADKKGT